MRVIVSTHQGKLYDEEVEYVVVKNPDGEFAMLKDHIPVVCVMENGYVKMVNSDIVLYVVIYKGMLEFHDNCVNVLAQEAHAGRDYESALKELEQLRNERRESNRMDTIDFTQKEKELGENIKKAGAGNL